MKFQNCNLFFVTDTQMVGRTDEQRAGWTSPMPLQLFQSWGHKNCSMTIHLLLTSLNVLSGTFVFKPRYLSRDVQNFVVDLSNCFFPSWKCKEKKAMGSDSNLFVCKINISFIFIPVS